MQWQWFSEYAIAVRRLLKRGMGAAERPFGLSSREVGSAMNGSERVVGKRVVGMVVQNGRTAPKQPRVVAFVWGGEERAQPSLPFGRWKEPVRPAA